MLREARRADGPDDVRELGEGGGVILSVSTVKDTVPNLEKFVRRNLAGGIDHLLVFLDDKQPEAAELLDAHPHVTCVRTHRGWWHGQRPRRLNERQGRNAALGARVLGAFDWADWVFHIDGDEVVDLDREVLDSVPAGERVVALEPWEAVSQVSWGHDPTWFKTLLDDDRLVLLSMLGVIQRPTNKAYFRGHVIGKVGVRPAPDLRVAIHAVADADDVRIEPFAEPVGRVLHYESPDGEEFARKWQALMRSGPAPSQRSGRASIGRAVAALLDLGLSDEEAKPFLLRMFDQIGVDDFETLRDLRLLREVDPDGWSRTPEPLPDDARQALADALHEERRERRVGDPSGTEPWPGDESDG
jgi:hypothetical protein